MIPEGEPALSWIDPEPYQRCPGCRTEQPASTFAGTDRCSTCRPKARVPKPRTSIAIRRAHLVQKYGITIEVYDALRAEQGYRCAICGTHEDEIPTRRTGRPRKDGQPNAEAAKLVVDHCHTTGQVRGLLCGGCNSALGHFGDSVEVMLSAIRYLRSEQRGRIEP